MGTGKGSECDACEISGKEVVMKKNKQVKTVKTETKICALCGKVIVGDYDYIKTKRGTEMYFHKGLRCRK